MDTTVYCNAVRKICNIVNSSNINNGGGIIHAKNEKPQFFKEKIQDNWYW